MSKRAAFAPLGLLTVAAMLPRAWSLKLVDLNRSRLRDKDILDADYVLISAMIVQRKSVEQVAAHCRRLGKLLIAGGPLFTTGHETFPDIDHFVLGESEDLMQEVVADMEAGCVRPVYEATGFPDVTKSPAPRWDLVDVNDYASMAVQYSRGCPFNCEFCDIIVMNGRVPRTKTPAQLIEELDLLRTRGWRGSVFLVDDNFIGNRRKAKDLLREIIAWRHRVGDQMSFTTEASVNLADDVELLELMSQAGFTRVFLGIETPEPEGLVECQKFQNTRRDLVQSVRTIQNAGIEVLGGFIVGFDADKPDIFERQFDFIQRAGVVTAMVGLLTALPKTQLHARMQREGRLLHDSSGNNTEAGFNFIPKLDAGFLTESYRSLMKKLYEPGVYYERARAFLAQYRGRGPRAPLGWTEIKAFARSLWVLGVWHRGRRQYWRYLGHVMMRHRPSFGCAVAIAIYGHHFRIVANKL